MTIRKIPIIGLVEAPGDVGARWEATVELISKLVLAHGPTVNEENRIFQDFNLDFYYSGSPVQRI